MKKKNEKLAEIGQMLRAVGIFGQRTAILGGGWPVAVLTRLGGDGHFERYGSILGGGWESPVPT